MPVHLPDTSRPRRTQLDPDFRKDPQTADYCVRCQKDFRPGQAHRWVFIEGRDFATVVHPASVDDAVLAKGEGWHRIGLDCAEKIGLEFSLPERPADPISAGGADDALPESVVSYDLADKIAEQLIAELLLQDNAWSAEFDEGEHLLVPPDADGSALAMTLPLFAAINKVFAGLVTQEVRNAADEARTAFLRDVDANDQISALNQGIDAAFAVALGSSRRSADRPIDLSDIPEADEALFARGTMSRLRRNLKQPILLAGQGPRVKPMEWKRRGNDWFADTVVGRYEVGLVHSGYVAILRHVTGNDAEDERIATSGSGVEQVMAACQSDLEKRIRSALEASP